MKGEEMRLRRIILLLEVVIVILTIMLSAGVGYAIETDNTLKIIDNEGLMPEQTDFKVQFTGEPKYKGEGVATLKLTGPTTATMNVTELKKVGDSATAIWTIENTSNDLYAEIDTIVTNTNTEYFDVKVTVSDSTLRPKTGKTTVKITVELIKSPINNDEKANISTKIVANPIIYN